MRIAIYHNLPSGGGKRALFEMARGLAASHEIDVFALSTADHDFCDLRPFAREHTAVPFRTLPLSRRPFGRVNQGIRALDLARLSLTHERIAQAIDGAGYDVVFAHPCQFGQSPGVLRYLRTPSLYYCQEPPRLVTEPQPPRPYRLYSPAQRLGNLFDPLPPIYRRTLRSMDRANVQAARSVIVNSAYSRESAYRVYGIFARRCYLGVDAQRFRPLSLPRAEFALSVGALSPRKGFDFLIESLARLPASRRPSLIIVSNHTEVAERAYLHGLAQALDVAVDLRPNVSEDELIALYNRARVVLYAPVMEPFGLAPLEGMACGTPVVAVGEAGVRESVIDGVTGLLTERDAQEFADATARVLDDVQYAEALGAAGREVACARWTWQKTTEQLERELARVAARSET